MSIEPHHTLATARQEERQRIAADLHDGIGQNLSAIQLTISGLRKVLRDRVSDAEDEQFGRLIRYVAKTIEEVEQICVDLHPSVLNDLGIVDAVDWFCNQLRPVLSDVDVDVIKTVRASEDGIPAPVKIAIFRIMQEACNNAYKHARPRQLSVFLEADAEGIRLEVTDDGVGFRLVPDRQSALGLGLHNMRERAAKTGGHLTVRSQPGRGTRVIATWQA